MDWATIKTDMITWAENVTGLTAYWNEAPRGFAYGPYCTISILGGLRKVGIDATKYLGEADSNVARVYGLREVTVSLRVWADSGDPDESALYYISSAMNAMSSPARLQELKDLGFGIVGYTPLTDETYDADGRRVSLAVLDIRMLTTTREDYASQTEVDIQRVTGTFDAGADEVNDFSFDSDEG